MRNRRAWLILAVAIVFTAVLTYPYLGLDIEDSRLDVRGEAHYAVLVAHVFTAAVALVLGPLQFLPGLRARKRIHRTIGKVYLGVGVLPAALTTIPVAILSGRLLTQLGLISAAILWLITGGLAYRAARRRDFGAHRDRKLRNYALTFLAVTARVLVPLMLVVQLPFGSVAPGEIGERATSMIPVGQTLAWIVNLAVAEVVIRRRNARSGHPRADPVTNR